MANNQTYGLTSLQARERLRRYGQNEISPKVDFSPVKLFLSQFGSPLIYILVIAGTVSFLLRDYADAIIIFLAVFFNAALSFYQENRAQNALTVLKTFPTV